VNRRVIFRQIPERKLNELSFLKDECKARALFLLEISEIKCYYNFVSSFLVYSKYLDLER
jgi:hypothetical protein